MTYRRLITITPGLKTNKLFYSDLICYVNINFMFAQRLYLFSFVCLCIVFSFVGDDYCTNTVPCFNHILLVWT